MDDVKKCLKCDNGKEIFEFNSRRDTQKYRSKYIHCCSIKQKEWRNNNPNKGKQNQKKNNEQNKERGNIYLTKKRETDVKIRLITNTRNRIYKSLESMIKQSSTGKFLGIDVDTYKKMDRISNDSRDEMV